MKSSLAVLIARFAASFVLSSFVCQAIAQSDASDSWPAIIVKVEDLHPLTTFKLRIPGAVSQGRVTGPSILKGHITAEGTVAKVILLESCGNPDLDEAAIHALRVMRYKPYMAAGVPTQATLALPVHVPAKFGRSPR